MDRSSIKPGQLISLTTNSAFYKNLYESRVIAVDKDMLCISMPSYKGLFVPLNVGFILNIKIFTDSGTIEFTTEVLYRNVTERKLYVRMPIHESAPAAPATETAASSPSPAERACGQNHLYHQSGHMACTFRP